MRVLRRVAVALTTLLASGGCGALIGIPDDEILGDPFAQDASGQDSPWRAETDTGDAGGDGPEAVSLSFVPTNVGNRIDGRTVAGDLVLDADNCNDIDTDRGTVACNADVTFVVLSQDGAADAAPLPRLGAFIARRIHIASGVVVHAHGANALVLVALESVEIDGSLVVAAHGERPGPGGFAGQTAYEADGNGPGGGRAAPHGRGASGGGASYCSAGGRGGEDVAGTGGVAGALYGATTLSPLVGGSSGGVADHGTSGAGGGAVQLIANVSVHIGKSGVINAGGGGATRDCIAGTAGGGSGGAILIEAPSIVVDGVVAANGGAGSSGSCYSSPNGTPPADGLPSATPAYDGDTSGAGAAGDTPARNGAPSTAHESTGGGGGGAGRLRFNASASGWKAATDSIVSPTSATGCATEGGLAPRADAGATSCAALPGRDACSTCAAIPCCAAATDCLAHEPCATCLGTPASARGPACTTDARLATYTQCLATWCPRECAGQ